MTTPYRSQASFRVFTSDDDTSREITLVQQCLQNVALGLERIESGRTDELSRAMVKTLDLMALLNCVDRAVARVKATENLVRPEGIRTPEEYKQFEVQPAEELFKVQIDQEKLHLAAQPQSIRVGPYRTVLDHFCRVVHEIQHAPDEHMPDPARFFADYEPDDDVVVAQAVSDYRCPLTQQYFEDPVTSRQCRHSFSRRAILDYRAQSLDVSRNRINLFGQHKVTCPVPGCNKELAWPDMVDNPQLAERTAEAKKREEREAAEHNQTLQVL